MNVSMMDSYNLSWKLVHSLHGLTPQSAEKRAEQTSDAAARLNRLLQRMRLEEGYPPDGGAS